MKNICIFKGSKQESTIAIDNRQKGWTLFVISSIDRRDISAKVFLVIFMHSASLDFSIRW